MIENKKLKALQDRITRQAQIAPRLAAIIAANPEFSEARFCADNEIGQSFFNRTKLLKRDNTATERTLNLIDKALKKEEIKIARKAKKNAKKG